MTTQCMFNMFSGDFQAASKFHSLACRTMFILGAHTLAEEFPPRVLSELADHSWREKVHLRKYFWLCYVFDKHLSLRTGQPPAIHDDHCILTIPHYYQGSLSEPLCGWDGTPSFPGELRLSVLKSKISTLLYSAEAINKSDAELLRDIRELDDELERWRLSVHPKFRPTFLHPNKCVEHDEVSDPQRILALLTSLEYFHLITVMHMETGRCRTWAREKSGGLDRVRSSLNLSVEASRSTLILLRAGIHYLRGESFW